MPKITNWDKMQNVTPQDTMKYHDVYEDQQLTRGNLAPLKTITSRRIATIAMSACVFVIVYLICSVVSGYNYIALTGSMGAFGYGFRLTFGKFLLTSAFTAAFYFVMMLIMKRNLEAQNALSDNADVNQWHNDQHIALPEEIQRNYDWFPDVGCTSDVQFSSMISHMALSNKGLKMIQVAKRASHDILDEDGEVVLYKGEVLTDDDGNVLYETKPIIDTDFMDALYQASGVPKGKTAGEMLRKYYDATKIKYNPDGSNRDKLGKFETVADLINKDWQLPYYEPQRPAGAYIVDTAPVNTMVLAITRAGKGQTVIEPTIDMWMRERRPNNMVINDPKGELLVKNYVRGTVRGFQIVQFNLINAMKTDIYNRASRFVMKSYNII
jgi:hypothetical protein